MTTIVQFTETNATLAAEIQAVMLTQVNAWSRLQYWAAQPGYVTRPFNQTDWHQHLTTPGLWWADWDGIYANLGTDGQTIANLFIGTPMAPGMIIGKPMPLDSAATLEIVTVADLVASGYLPPPPPPLV